MPISLGHSLNKPVSVSIPALFGDDQRRVCTLMGIEPGGGVWLAIADPHIDVLQTAKGRGSTANVNVFVPFAQIAYLVDSVPAANSHETQPKRKKPS